MKLSTIFYFSRPGKNFLVEIIQERVSLVAKIFVFKPFQKLAFVPQGLKQKNSSLLFDF